ncbi:DUF1490 family protein [Williamsia sterculiae]|uniref:DUF1490 family protein n=1 Tax=Williamsia sterculiae TaxID=1344003 RepID=A0A1N7CUX6_9NOCA|nr:DUF1490 family protein [Williamsia sterculiae]SIR67285.1 Protein of unknown function [Williamsia sterculiae]
MPVHAVIVKAATTLATGVAGAAGYDLLKRSASRIQLREAAVTTTAWGLRGSRRAEAAAESARLQVADVVAEARSRIGEEATPPTAGRPHDHEH